MGRINPIVEHAVTSALTLTGSVAKQDDFKDYFEDIESVYKSGLKFCNEHLQGEQKNYNISYVKLKLGKFYLRTNQDEQAYKCFDYIIGAYNPSSKKFTCSARIERAGLELSRGEYIKAEKDLKKAVDLNPDIEQNTKIIDLIRILKSQRVRQFV